MACSRLMPGDGRADTDGSVDVDGAGVNLWLGAGDDSDGLGVDAPPGKEKDAHPGPLTTKTIPMTTVVKVDIKLIFPRQILMTNTPPDFGTS